jgi:TolB-like protein
MKKLLSLLIISLLSNFCFSQQIKVAIVDFDNISGIAKYDGLGKAMSSMLISDIEANVSPKRLQLVERSQINKILKEQNFQKTSSVDKASTVKLGKLLGVRYLLVGDIFILNDALIINSRLIDTENGAIKFTEKKEGKLAQWLFLKSGLAKDLSTSISMPFTEPVVLDKEINPAVITTFSNAISEKDNGNIDKANALINTTKEFEPGFKYIDELKVEIEKLRINVGKLQLEVETTVSNPAQVGSTYFETKNYSQAIKYFTIGLNRIPNTEFGKKYAYFLFLSEAHFYNNNFEESIKYADTTLTINPYEIKAIFLKASALVKMNRLDEGIKILKKVINENNLIGSSEQLMKSLYNFSMKNRLVVFRGLIIEHQGGSISFNEKIQYPNYEEFRIDFEEIFKRKTIKITSDNFDFKQDYGLDVLISLYTDLLSSSGIDPILIAKSIDEFEWGTDTIDKFYNSYKTGIYGNTYTGLIDKNSKYVVAKSGKPYTGPAHFYSYGFDDLQVYSNNNTDVSDFKIVSKEDILQINKTARMNQYSSNIECPCEVLLENEVYEEIKKNKTNIFVNSFVDASKYTNSSWFYLIGKNYQKSLERLIPIINFYIKLSNSIDGKGLPKKNFDKYRMTMINLGHTYLLMGNYQKANEIYTNKILYTDFGDDWGNMSSKEIVKNDWDDFIGKNLISKEKLAQFNQQYSIIQVF